MRNIIFIITAFFAVIAAACSGSGSSGISEADRAAADSAGRRDAAIAVAAPQGSMERENTLFAIRARETRLRDSGYDEAADAYVAGAESVLAEGGVIEIATSGIQ